MISKKRNKSKLGKSLSSRSIITGTMSNENLQEEISQLRRDLQNLNEIDEATRDELSKLEKLSLIHI